MSNFEYAFERVIAEEGGYVNDPDDPGGETNFGISKRAYPNVDIKGLTIAKAKAIYLTDYWNRSLAGKCDKRLSTFIFDAAVNMGLLTSNKLVQSLVGAYPDGFIGDNTLLAITEAKIISLDDDQLSSALNTLVLGRIQIYVAIVKKNPLMRKYLMGWTSRALGFLDEY